MADSEILAIEAGEKLLRALDFKPISQLASQFVMQCHESLSTGKKDRKRQGKAIFHIAGELVKQGGSVKNWKTRWYSLFSSYVRFVVDDSCINYFKDVQEWESGPVEGDKLFLLFSFSRSCSTSTRINSLQWSFGNYLSWWSKVTL